MKEYQQHALCACSTAATIDGYDNLSSLLTAHVLAWSRTCDLSAYRTVDALAVSCCHFTCR
jgi:hypothetical protein